MAGARLLFHNVCVKKVQISQMKKGLLILNVLFLSCHMLLELPDCTNSTMIRFA